MGGGKQQQEITPQERAQLEIGSQQMADWRKRWLPVLSGMSKQIDAMAAPDSYERRHATAQAGADTTVRFAAAGDKALAGAAATGAIGSAKQKLGIVNMGNDEATSAGFGATRADQAVDDAVVLGNKSLAALGRGEKADTINALGRSAALASEQARADAEQSLAENAGYASVAGKAAGTGLGLWMGGTPLPFGQQQRVDSSVPMEYDVGRMGR